MILVAMIKCLSDDVDQTCLFTLIDCIIGMGKRLEWGKQVIDFGDHDPIFKVTFVMFDQMLSYPYLMNSEQI